MCKHITLVLPNRPGQVRDAAEKLAKSQINVLGFALHSEGKASFLNVFCSPHDEAYRVLELTYKQFCVEREVLVVKTPHNIGALSAILVLLQDANINLPTSYMAITETGHSALVLEIRNSADRSLAVKLLVEAGHQVVQAA